MPTDQHPSASTSRNAPDDRWIAPTLALATFLSALGTHALGPFLPIIARDLTTSIALLGQVPAAAALAAAVLGLVAGPLADQFGHRRAVLVALGCLTVSALLTGLAPSVAILLLAFLIGAIGRAAATPAAQAIASARFEGDARRRAMSWITAGVSSSLVAGVPLLTLLDAGLGWRGAFGGLALLTAGGALLAWRSLTPDRPSSAGGLRLGKLVAAYRPIAAHQPTRRLIVAQVFGLAGTATLTIYLGAFLAERHGFSTQQIGGVYLALGAGALVGSAAVGGRLGALPLRSLLGGGRLVIGLIVGGVLLLPLPALVAVGLLVVGVALMAVANTATPTLLAAETPAGRATTMALNSAAMSLGNALGAALGGLLLALGGFSALGLAGLAWYVASAGLVWWSRPRRVAAPEVAAQPSVG